MDNENFAWDEVWRKRGYASPKVRRRKAQKKFAYMAKHNLIGRSLGDTLEIGCGSCDFIHIASESCIDVPFYIGIDKSYEALDRARDRAFKGEKHLVSANFLEYIPERKFDTILAIGCLEHIKNEAEAIDFMIDCIKPGGSIIMVTSNKRSIMYYYRIARQKLGLWPYGYQKNHDHKDFVRWSSLDLQLCHIQALQGDWDFPVATAIDKLLSFFMERWGRYLVVTFKKNGDSNGSGI